MFSEVIPINRNDNQFSDISFRLKFLRYGFWSDKEWKNNNGNVGIFKFFVSGRNIMRVEIEVLQVF